MQAANGEPRPSKGEGWVEGQDAYAESSRGRVSASLDEAAPRHFGRHLAAPLCTTLHHSAPCPSCLLGSTFSTLARRLPFSCNPRELTASRKARTLPAVRLSLPNLSLPRTCAPALSPSQRSPAAPGATVLGASFPPHRAARSLSTFTCLPRPHENHHHRRRHPHSLSRPVVALSDTSCPTMPVS